MDKSIVSPFFDSRCTVIQLQYSDIFCSIDNAVLFGEYILWKIGNIVS